MAKSNGVRGFGHEIGSTRGKEGSGGREVFQQQEGKIGDDSSGISSNDAGRQSTERKEKGWP